MFELAMKNMGLCLFIKKIMTFLQHSKMTKEKFRKSRLEKNLEFKGLSINDVTRNLEFVHLATFYMVYLTTMAEDKAWELYFIIQLVF